MDRNKIIWFEVLTPKQAMLFLAIGNRLQKLGFQPHFTTRKHDYIHDIFKAFNVTPFSSGGYGGKTLEGKLLESTKRMVKLTEHITSLEERPLAAISFSSPDASRVAFGLGIPIILLNDTAHSIPVGKLTFALANYLITPSCIEKDRFVKLGANPYTMYNYKGVDEVEYIAGDNFKNFKALREKNSHRYLVYRPEESFASYMKDKDSKPYLEIIEHLINSYEGDILIFPRYEEQQKIISEKFADLVQIPQSGFYFLNLLSKAEVVITGGGTMAREAALLGIPSITYFWRHLEPQEYIEKRGFPSYSVQGLKGAKKIIEKICSKPSDFWVDTSKKLTKLQKPSDVLIPLMKKDSILRKYF